MISPGSAFSYAAAFKKTDTDTSIFGTIIGTKGLKGGSGMSSEQKKRISFALIECYADYLREQEKSPATVAKYIHDLKAAAVYLTKEELTKPMLIAWKERIAVLYAVSSVNTMLAALNGYLAFFGWSDLQIKPLKKHREIFCPADKELSRAEYIRLVHAAKREGNLRLSLVLQTICSTGIRVSELRHITVEAAHTGRAEVNCKGKQRTVFLPKELCRLLQNYAKKQERTTGPVFVTKTGRSLDRSNIWREMKALCKSAGVESGKVFPHNLRHLFARTFYALEKDLFRLADLLGHASIDTTRIYTVESGAAHVRQMERMKLVIT